MGHAHHGRRQAAGLIALLLSAALLLAGCSAAGSPTAGAGSAGELVSSQDIQLFVVPGVPMPGDSYFFEYRSRDRNDREVPVTATVTVPRIAWNGPGERPIVAYAVGTHGVAEKCAPSVTMHKGIDYEAALVELLLLRGYAVVVTDYLGYGTGELPTYIDRLDQGHAVLDAVRAALQLPQAGLSKDAPVATFGYSQGGLGSAAALELAPRYAPELNLVAGYAGAIPSDLIGALDTVDGTIYAGLMGNAIIGLDNAHPDQNLRARFNDAGQRYIDATSQQCVLAVVVPHLLTQSRRLTLDGRTLGDQLRDPVWQPVLRALQIGHTPPAVPALVIQSRLDDVVPFASSRDAAARWCTHGASVEFRASLIPTHIGAAYPAGIAAIAWLAERFDGEPAQNNCGEF